jgi:hypothetical protein
MSTELSNRIPAPDELDPERVRLVYDRLSVLLDGVYPDIDTSPNSVFGDAVLRPLVYLVAGVESAQDCLLNDLDILRLARGDVCDCDWAESALRGLGVYASSPTTIATVRLTFSTDVPRSISNTARILFGGDTLVRIRTAQPSEIELVPTGTWGDDPDNNVYRLVPGPEEDTFSVDLPVYGPAGADVDVDAIATTDIADPFLQEVRLVSRLRAVAPPADLKKAARQAGKFFPAGALTTRSSTEAFFRQRLGNLGAVSVTVPGDWETTRGAINLFGVSRGVMDIYLRGNEDPIIETATLQLVRNTDESDWRGLLKTGQRVPLRILSV